MVLRFDHLRNTAPSTFHGRWRGWHHTRGRKERQTKSLCIIYKVHGGGMNQKDIFLGCPFELAIPHGQHFQGQTFQSQGTTFDHGESISSSKRHVYYIDMSF